MYHCLWKNKEREGEGREGKTVFEQQVDKARKIGLSSKPPLLFLFVYYFCKISASFFLY